MKPYNGKTIEELWDIFTDARASTDSDSENACDKAGIQAVAEACTPQWISVEKELPYRSCEPLLLFISGGEYLGYQSIGTRDLNDGRFKDFETGNELMGVTHRMPLPEPPK